MVWFTAFLCISYIITILRELVKVIVKYIEEKENEGNAYFVHDKQQPVRSFVRS
jgi:hypothetical protein